MARSFFDYVALVKFSRIFADIKIYIKKTQTFDNKRSGISERRVSLDVKDYRL